jgi:hypothetical protein
VSLTTGPLVSVDDLRQVLDLPEALVPDADLQAVTDAVDAAIIPLLSADEDHTLHANAREAALGMAVQVWQSRHAPGGQMVGVDLNPQMTPHLLGPGLVARYAGLLGPCLAYGGAVTA